MFQAPAAGADGAPESPPRPPRLRQHHHQEAQPAHLRERRHHEGNTQTMISCYARLASENDIPLQYYIHTVL